MCSACETHEGDARVWMGRTPVEHLCYANDRTRKVDVACGLSIYGTVRLDLDGK